MQNGFYVFVKETASNSNNYYITLQNDSLLHKIFEILKHGGDNFPTLVRREIYLAVNIHAGMVGKAGKGGSGTEDRERSGTVGTVEILLRPHFLSKSLLLGDSSFPTSFSDAPTISLVIQRCDLQALDGKLALVVHAARRATETDVCVLKTFRAEAAKKTSPADDLFDDDAPIGRRMTTIGNISNHCGKLCIKARVTEKTTIKAYTGGELFSCVLDDGEERIEGVAFTDCCRQLFNCIETGKTYIFTDAKLVKITNQRFSVVPNQKYKIIFKKSTLVEETTESN